MKTVYIWGSAKRFANYRRAVESAGGRVRFGGDPAGCDALLLPGGGDLEPRRYGQRNTASVGLEPARDAMELNLLQQFALQKKPILGICRGLQCINIYFGGTLLQDIPGHSAAGGIDRLHTVRNAPSPLRTLYGDRHIVNSAHHQAADRLGSGLAAVQWSPDGVVEAVRHHALPILAVQWHPERLFTDDRNRLFSWFLEQGL